MTYGSWVLEMPARPITDINERISGLVDDMFETMTAAPGVGLAAPQVGVAEQVFVWSYSDTDGDHRGVAINPTLRKLPIFGFQKQWVTDEEGCLSVPGLRYPTRRARRVRLTATNLAGESYTLEATDWLARIFQHEYDHLQGTLYLDRLRGAALSQAAEEVPQHVETDSQWTPGADLEEADFAPQD